MTPEPSNRGTVCLIGLGANLGNRSVTLQSAWSHLGQIESITTLRLSHFLETPAAGGPEQPPYLNAAGLLQTTLTAEQLLHNMQQIELTLHRERKIHWGPRTVDLDLLLFGEQKIKTSTLTVPHPQLYWREFVLKPGAEIAPQMKNPVTGWTMLEHWFLLRFNVSIAYGLRLRK